MSSKKIITLANLTTFKTNADAAYQPKDADLTAIAAISETSGLLKKTAANTWTLDTNTYATQSYVDGKVTSAYIFKGTKSVNEMNALTSGQVIGWVYNVSGSGTITSGASDISVNAGDNVAWDGTNWDVLAGTVDLSGYQLKVSALGSTTKPVYTSAAGTFAECSTYAGGTAVTLNNSSKAASTASFYAPTSGGAKGTVLIGGGASSAPVWLTAGSSGKFLKSTGSGTDPEWADVDVLPKTSTANKLLLSTATEGTTLWSSWSSAGFLKTDSSGVVSVDTNTYLTSQTWREIQVAGTSKLASSASTALNFLNVGNVTFAWNTADSNNGLQANVDLSGYLPLSAGSTKALTGDLYLSKGSYIKDAQGSNSSSSAIQFHTKSGGTITDILALEIRREFITIYSGKFSYGGNNYSLPSLSSQGNSKTLALTDDIPTVTTSVTSGSTDVITSGAVFTALGLGTGEDGLVEATTAEINALFA